MEFALTLETDLSKTQSLSIVELSKRLELYFYNKNYGEDVLSILIGIIALDITGLESIFKVRKPKYVDFEIIKYGLGNPVEISKSLSWDTKPDYELLTSLEGIALQSVIARSVMNSIKELKLPKKVQRFDVEAFAQDVEFFLKNEDLI